MTSRVDVEDKLQNVQANLKLAGEHLDKIHDLNLKIVLRELGNSIQILAQIHGDLEDRHASLRNRLIAWPRLKLEVNMRTFEEFLQEDLRVVNPSPDILKYARKLFCLEFETRLMREGMDKWQDYQFDIMAFGNSFWIEENERLIRIPPEEVTLDHATGMYHRTTKSGHSPLGVLKMEK